MVALTSRSKNWLSDPYLALTGPALRSSVSCEPGMTALATRRMASVHEADLSVRRAAGRAASRRTCPPFTNAEHFAADVSDAMVGITAEVSCFRF